VDRVPEYYESATVWPKESLDRRAAALKLG
jgi:hypothetical protein